MEANWRTIEGTLVPRLVADNDTANSDNNVQTVTLASPLNGQFYVIGSPSDLLATSASVNNQRSIAPRTFNIDGSTLGTTKQIELKEVVKSGSVTIQPDKIAREEKLGNRRATHNEVERRRRDNINHWIMKLGKLIPADSDDDPLTLNGGKQALSKGGILAKACEYLADVRETNNYLREALAEKEEVIAENEKLQTELQKLKEENTRLRDQLLTTRSNNRNNITTTITTSSNGNNGITTTPSSHLPSIKTSEDLTGTDSHHLDFDL